MKDKKILFYLLILAGIIIVSYLIYIASINQQIDKATKINPDICNNDTNNCFDATEKCGNLQIINIDSQLVNLKEAKDRCSSLCPTCGLPTIDELTCICNNKALFGNNYENSYYWSSSNDKGMNTADNLDFSLCAYRSLADGRNKYYALCIRRY